MKVRAKISVYRTNVICFGSRRYGTVTHLKILIGPNAPDPDSPQP